MYSGGCPPDHQGGNLKRVRHHAGLWSAFRPCRPASWYVEGMSGLIELAQWKPCASTLEGQNVKCNSSGRNRLRRTGRGAEREIGG